MLGLVPLLFHLVEASHDDSGVVNIWKVVFCPYDWVVGIDLGARPPDPYFCKLGVLFQIPVFVVVGLSIVDPRVHVLLEGERAFEIDGVELVCLLPFVEDSLVEYEVTLLSGFCGLLHLCC